MKKLYSSDQMPEGQIHFAKAPSTTNTTSSNTSFMQAEACPALENKASIDQSITFMNEKYAEELTRESLSAVAGMSLWHYSHQFKHWVGKSPIDYLNSIRINKAKEQLLQSGMRVKEVASQVGFEDEFYFSRKFKKAAGISPKEYAAWTTRRIAAFSFPYAGHLLSLGIMPYAALVDSERDVHRKTVLPEIPYHLRRSKRMDQEMVDYNRNTLVHARPELIFCDDMVDEQVSSSISRIARTVVIPWLGLNWRQQFIQIASHLGKTRAADQWLADYDARASLAGEKIRKILQSDSVSILHIMLGHLIVYGRRNGGAVLYEDLSLHCPYDPDTIDVLKSIQERELPAYTGDRLFLIIDSDAASQQKWQSLQHTEIWKQLKSVREGTVHLISECPWLDYSPFAHSIIIEEALRLCESN